MVRIAFFDLYTLDGTTHIDIDKPSTMLKLHVLIKKHM